jgi:DNA-binding winged helix-turn-helix (wHTH) protein
MPEASNMKTPLRSLRFGPFELSSDSGELRKNGVCLKLSGQSIQVLLTLTERPGHLVSREELQQKLWPGDSYGEFGHGLNAAVNRLRGTLGDDADNPRYIETLPRRGYRFVGPITPRAPIQITGAVKEEKKEEPSHKTRKRKLLGVGIALAVVSPLFALGLYLAECSAVPPRVLRYR